MTDTLRLRAAIIGLLGCTAIEEELLLAAAHATDGGQGSPECWAAVPLVAHNTEFKSQQVTRLAAIRHGEVPPEFAETDHRSAQVYRGYRQQNAGQVLQASREVTAALIDEVSAIGDDDLLDPSRHPWLRGRALWLQIIVRGFWHPTGHIGDYYLDHDRPGRAVAAQEHAVAMASYLAAPEPARGMAHYNLACALARSQRAADAVGQLKLSVELNPALVANIGRDEDLAALRASGQLDALLVS